MYRKFSERGFKKNTSPLLCSDLTGSGCTKGGAKGQVRQAAIDCPHWNACWEYGRRTEETRDGRSQARSQAFRGTSESTSERQVILVLRYLDTSVQDIYTNVQNSRSGIQVGD